MPLRRGRRPMLWVGLLAVVLFAPGPTRAMCANACSGHGFCNSFNVCDCNRGFTGGDCSLLRCPVGKAWGLITATDTAHQMAECSGRGTCVTSSGTCSCQNGFEGSACQHVICLESCSSRGRCITMEQLASDPLTALNLLDKPPLEYSSYVMWDADMIRGCLCDDGYGGYNCLIDRCHGGDDPLTTGQTEEIQLVTCTASYLQHTIALQYDTTPTAGTFVLKFGRLRTSPINFNAPASAALGTSMTEMLQTLPTIPAVTVARRSTATATFWDLSFAPSSVEQHSFQPRWRVVEVQSFFCAADSGYLSLLYNKYLFGNIPSTALASDLKLKLESYVKIGTVDVTYSSGTTLCRASGNQVTIAFTLMRDRDFIGDLPALVVDAANQGQRNGLFLGGLAPTVDAVATEIVKGIDTCHRVEVQSLTCGATSGFFSLSFEGRNVSNLPYTIAAADLRLAMLASGNQVTIAFTLMRDRDFIGDLPALVVDAANQGQRNGLFLGGLAPTVDAVATEIVKGIDTCHRVEVQSLTCGATSGFFSLSFEGRTVSNLPYTIAAADLRLAMLGAFPSLIDIDVTYSSGTEACDSVGAGTVITISYVVVSTNGPSGNGDLSALTADRTNGGTSGLAHASPNLLQLTASAVEVTKGARCVPLSSTFVSAPTQQITSTVVLGGGEFSLGFRGQSTGPIPATARPSQVVAALTKLPAISGVDVTFTTGEACATPANVIKLVFTQEFGNVPTVTADARGSPVTVQVFASGAVDPVTSLASTDGTKEVVECSGRGTCDYSKGGACKCYTGYIASNGRGLPATSLIRRDDCGAMAVTIASCPGDVPCSGHGTCSNEPMFKCTCAVGWRNGDCSERECPHGLSWFSYPLVNNVAHRDFAECSNVGLCDRTTALCQCSPPYVGPSCALMACGGSGNECSGHGQCLTLRQLAPLVRSNGVVAGFTFGDDPNNPWTWEAEKIQSCLCDPPFYGYDCSLVDCPHGDDPNTYLDVQEVQQVQCIASGGSFTLTFREQTTASIAWNANLATVKQALEALQSIESVVLTFSGSSTTVCTATTPGVTTTIRFVYELGALPCLQNDKSQLLDAVQGDGTPGTGTVNVNCGGETLLGQYLSVVGTREDAVCSNHGVCDTQVGVCRCDPFYASSDGLGGAGLRGDCSFRTAMAKGGGGGGSSAG
ncbi:hypothetical protein H257_16764 [Aphanomyces astaci]|uniref:EGF-like domain-containing protein n=1 Tax=Aphanomyces astaci TaxID=112090 RepID=W4FJP7_APHAT|nr:hypothetical protein H257_16764 [Aphanomyces astaci]ETV66968.1 hypothetical protein H257_16764 [Aphanomyces astaci]|eukprot:XP_009843609.1 hypothetical protein H257_16764 [Aphanomyces astaci]